ncbi:DUF3397 domain-containing protein [Paenibacillus sp. HB172176]|uniref:DUF3397 domain-containing protein n=1 Tax=Paenibacillus sp. HB172176 TaxID=2493690 RepID=UPI00143BEC1E|nr:DUF3397 domain-containing protein [Paenibacillus sp. HB172176]
MSAIWNGLHTLIAILALVPILPFAIVFFGYQAFADDRKNAFRMAMDISTALLILCVAALFNMLFDNNFGLYGILLVMLLTGGLLGNAQFRKRGNVDVKRIFKAIWRLSFFAMSVLYVIFMIVMLGKVIFTTA